MSREGGDEREDHRDPTTGRFTPGRSPNPSGRPKGIVAVAKAKNLRDLVLLAAELISSGSRQMSRGRFPACWGRSFR
jgi:hypothetical protein